MSNAQATGASKPLRSKQELVGWIAAGFKPQSDWRIGTEHEKFVFHTDDLSPVPYEGPRGIGALLKALIAKYDWQAIMEGDNIIGLKRPAAELGSGDPGSNVSLEPGGQFELSGAPLETLHQVCSETNEHLREVRAVGEPLQIGFLGVGFSPKWRLDEIPVMPKERYKVMKRYMPMVGKHGLDMMFRTATIQVNLDFSSEADLVKKMRVSLALQPIATALFASSPFTEGKPNGFQSMRSAVWRDTDRRRTGMLPFVFEKGMGIERYVDYALDVPMYFIYRDGKYIDVAGASFRDFMAGKLSQAPGMLPTLDDWSDHLTTLFPEVRLKRFIEMRGADGGPWNRICALPAFWVGLLYDQGALDAAWDMVKDWTGDERQALRDEVPVKGFKTRFRNSSVLELSREAVAIAVGGLKARAIKSRHGDLETVHLAPLQAMLDKGESAADELLRHYNSDWGGNIDRIFADYAF